MSQSDAASWLQTDAAPCVVAAASHATCTAAMEAAAALDFRVVCLDLAGVDTKPALLDRLAAALDFPDCFGHNWDALADALGDLSWHRVPGLLLVLGNSARLQYSAPADFNILLEIFEESAAAQDPTGLPFLVLIRPDDA